MAKQISASRQGPPPHSLALAAAYLPREQLALVTLSTHSKKKNFKVPTLEQTGLAFTVTHSPHLKLPPTLAKAHQAKLQIKTLNHATASNVFTHYDLVHAHDEVVVHIGNVLKLDCIHLPIALQNVRPNKKILNVHLSYMDTMDMRTKSIEIQLRSNQVRSSSITIAIFVAD